MSFLRKALKAGLSPGNICSWLSLEMMRHSGVIFGSLRFYCKARLFGIRVGKEIRAHGPVGLMRWPGSKIIIGNKVSFISSWRRSTAACLAFPVRLRTFFPGALIEIGDNCELSGVSITARSTSIKLAKQVLVGPNTIITDSDFHSPWPAQERAANPGIERDSPVTIEDYAWIGMNCIILKGVTIGSGAIVGAGSVVSRDVPPNCLACGNPARIVKKLDS